MIKAYLARPEMMPPDDACEAERNCTPTGGRSAAISKAEIAAIADPDARENWNFMMSFRDRLVAARRSRLRM